MMAALTAPSIRSTSRRSLNLSQQSATVTQFQIPNTTRSAKRKREVSCDNDDLHLAQRQVFRPRALPRPKADNQPAVARLELPFQTAALKDVVTQVDFPQDPDPVLQDIDRRPTYTSNSSSPTRITGSSELAEVATQGEKRSLRSQDSRTRYKSELASYFCNYDEIVSNESHQPELLTSNTCIFIIDEPAKLPTTNLPKQAIPKRPSKTSINAVHLERPSFNGPHNTVLTSTAQDYLNLNEAQRIELPTIDDNTRAEPEDVLGDQIYMKAHRRAERSEKQLRNLEKERATHEKFQLERLLDGLRGHEWLKVMGVSGVPDSDKKSWQPKRDYFIEEIETLLSKFRNWKEEEKRRKAERDERLLANEDEDTRNSTVSRTPEASDLDGRASKHLRQDAVTAAGCHKRVCKSNTHAASFSPVVEKPFTSFYSKPYLREAALGKHRHGRTRFAFGQPLPNIQVKDFELPQELLTQDALAASARSRRRARRESKV